MKQESENVLNDEDAMFLLDTLEKAILAKKDHHQYCRIKGEGTPYQDISHYMITYVDVSNIKKVFERFRKTLKETS